MNERQLSRNQTYAAEEVFLEVEFANAGAMLLNRLQNLLRVQLVSNARIFQQLTRERTFIPSTTT